MKGLRVYSTLTLFEEAKDLKIALLSWKTDNASKPANRWSSKFLTMNALRLSIVEIKLIQKSAFQMVALSGKG
jgi:hypothetical protein